MGLVASVFSLSDFSASGGKAPRMIRGHDSAAERDIFDVRRLVVHTDILTRRRLRPAARAVCGKCRVKEDEIDK
jgi:hypothetical protein